MASKNQFKKNLPSVPLFEGATSAGQDSAPELVAVPTLQSRGNRTNHSRSRKDDSKGGKLRGALLDLLAEHQRDETLPTSVRFLFYELCSRGVISKKASGARTPDQDVSRQLMYLREDGDIPWDWISDETKSLDEWNTAPTVVQWLTEALDRARIDPWLGDPPLIITESRSLRGALSNVAHQYACPITSTNGQAGGFLHTVVAPALREGQKIIYLGDLDLSGIHIEQNIRRVLEDEVGELGWKRLALTQEQADKFGLTPISKYDGRTKKYHDAIETEALSQTTIVQLVRDELESILPEPLDIVRRREREQRRKALEILGDAA